MTPLTDEQLHGTPCAPQCCGRCLWFSVKPYAANQGYCTESDPGRRGRDYPEHFGGDLACGKFEAKRKSTRDA